MKSLETNAVEYVMCHADIYCPNFPYLPPHIKNRILKRMMSIKVHRGKIFEIFKNLMHHEVKQLDFSLIDVNDDFLKISKHCHELTQLILTRTENTVLSTEVLMATLPNFSKLITFQAENCFGLTDEVIRVVVQGCRRLSEVDIAGCKQITDLSTKYLSELDNLTAINLSRTEITDVGLKFLTEGPSVLKIRELRLADCDNIASESVKLIGENFKNLQVFIFSKSSASKHHENIDFDKLDLTNVKQITWTIYY